MRRREPYPHDGTERCPFHTCGIDARIVETRYGERYPLWKKRAKVYLTGERVRTAKRNGRLCPSIKGAECKDTRLELEHRFALR